MNEKYDIINIGTELLQTNMNEILVITDIYYNLHTNNVEMMAKRKNDDSSAIYIPQIKLEEWLKKDILQILTNGGDLNESNNG